MPRIARKQAKQAIKALEAHQQSRDRVHEARTSVKKLRGLLRLVGPSLGDRYRRENARLGDLGDQLSQLRDAEVMIQTFDGLFHQFRDQLNAPLRRVRTRLTRRLRGVERRLDVSEHLSEAARAFRKTRKRAKKWMPATGGWDAVADGLGDTYRWGRRAMATAYHRTGAGLSRVAQGDQISRVSRAPARRRLARGDGWPSGSAGSPGRSAR